MAFKRKIIYSVIIYIFLFLFIESFSFAFLRLYYKSKQNDKFTRFREDTLLYLNRAHPLFADNRDLRERTENMTYHPIVGYKFVPETLLGRQHHSYMSFIEVDKERFVHNGDPLRNTEMLTKPSKEIYRTVFLGGSTTVGRGSSTNENTIPALFEDLLEEKWPSVDFHVINAGVLGYHTTMERLYYSFYVKPMNPDLLVFMDGVNDAVDAGFLKEWEPYYSSMWLTTDQYQDFFKPRAAFANYIQTLLEFPQPLYSLFVMNKFFKKMNVAKDTEDIKLKKFDKKYYYHSEAKEQLSNNLQSIAQELSLEGSRGVFLLQPLLGMKKPHTSDYEKHLEERISSIYRNYFEIIPKYFEDFAEVYRNLDGQFADNKKIKFLDVNNIFENDRRHIYESIWHYNDDGNRTIAENIFESVRKDIEKDLYTKGLIEF